MQARKGDRESLAKLILPYGPALYLGALRLTRNPAEAEDVRQEAFLKAISRLEQFNGSQDETRDDLHAWVSRIATNASIDVIRKRRDGKILSLEEPSGAGEETLGSNVATPEKIRRNALRGARCASISRMPSSDLLPTCGRSASCAMFCSIRRKKSRSAWEFRPWR